MGESLPSRTQNRKEKMTQTLSDKRVFVTGGASGIGRAIVIAFVERGARVAFCDVNETAARSLLERYPQLIFYPADVTDAEVLNRVVNTVINQFGDIDILINNVGISEFSPLVETSIEQFDRILSTNLRPVFITSRALAIHRNTLGHWRFTGIRRRVGPLMDGLLISPRLAICRVSRVRKAMRPRKAELSR